MFNWLFKKNEQKVKREKTFVCKHCKYTCHGCAARYCYSCYSNLANSCAKCGKTNLQEKRKPFKI